MNKKIITTEKAKMLINDLRESHGELIFYMSGGCCEGSQPNCFKREEFFPGITDQMIGMVEGCEFYLSSEQAKYYNHSQLILDALEGMAGGFSLEAPMGRYFKMSSGIIFENQEI